MPEYKVLKKFEDYKKNDAFNTTDVDQEIIDGLVADGFIALVEEDESDTDAVTVTWREGSRVYSKEVHGKEFMSLAKQFVSKHGGTIS